MAVHKKSKKNKMRKTLFQIGSDIQGASAKDKHLVYASVIH